MAGKVGRPRRIGPAPKYIEKGKRVLVWVPEDRLNVLARLEAFVIKKEAATGKPQSVSGTALDFIESVLNEIPDQP